MNLKELREMGFKVLNIEMGNDVICDGCNADMTNSLRVGGVLLQRSAFCPDCSPRIIESAKKYHEESYLSYPKEDETFYNFVLRIR